REVREGLSRSTIKACSSPKTVHAPGASSTYRGRTRISIDVRPPLRSWPAHGRRLSPIVFRRPVQPLAVFALPGRNAPAFRLRQRQCRRGFLDRISQPLALVDEAVRHPVPILRAGERRCGLCPIEERRVNVGPLDVQVLAIDETDELLVAIEPIGAKHRARPDVKRNKGVEDALDQFLTRAQRMPPQNASITIGSSSSSGTSNAGIYRSTETGSFDDVESMASCRARACAISGERRK